MSLPRGAPNLFVASVVAGFLLVGLVLMMLLGPVPGWSLLIAGTWGAMLIGRPKLLLFIYWCWVTVSLYVQAFFGNMLTMWGDEMLAAVMLGILLMHHIRSRIHLPELRVARRALVALLALIAISALVNRVPRLLAFHFCLQYMRFFLLLYYAYFFLYSRDLKGVTVTFVVLFLLQVAMNAGWLFHINPLPDWIGGVDFAIGTGLGANIVAYYAVAFICVMIAYVRNSAGPFRKGLAWIGILLGLFQLYISFTLHAYLLCAGCVGLQILVAPVSNLRRAAYLAEGAVVAGLAILIVSVTPAAQSLREILGPENIKYRAHSMMIGPKGQSYVNNLKYLPHELPFPLLGAGPGNAGSMVARMNRRPLADKYFNWVNLSIQERSLSEGGSISGGPMTGMLTLWSELGPLGWLTYWSFFVYAFFRISRLVAQGAYKDRYKRILAEAFPPVMVMMILLNFLADYVYLAFMNNGIWIWAACVWTPESDLPPSVRFTDVAEPSDVWQKVLAGHASAKT